MCLQLPQQCNGFGRWRRGLCGHYRRHTARQIAETRPIADLRSARCSPRPTVVGVCRLRARRINKLTGSDRYGPISIRCRTIDSTFIALKAVFPQNQRLGPFALARAHDRACGVWLQAPFPNLVRQQRCRRLYQHRLCLLRTERRTQRTHHRKRQQNRRHYPHSRRKTHTWSDYTSA